MDGINIGMVNCHRVNNMHFELKGKLHKYIINGSADSE